VTARDRFEAVVEAGSYMTIATAGIDDDPWVTPVWFASADGREVLWISRPGARHSQHIAARPRIAIFDSPGTGAGAYVALGAALVPGDELEDAVAPFSRISQTKGAGSFARSDVDGDAPHRMYRAVARERYVLSSRDERSRVD
jgi:hypothetical protein